MASPPLYDSPAFRDIAGDTWRPGGLSLTQQGLNVCAFRPGARLLDVGCGAGATLTLLLEEGYAALGLDRKTHCPKGLPFVQSDAPSLPFLAGSFDGIICECVLSLLPKKDMVLANFARLLKPGGKLLLADLYWQEGQSYPSNDSTALPASCFEGAPGRGALEMMLTRAGFHRIIFTDHTAALRALAARLIWYGKELSSLFHNHCQLSPNANGCSRRPGYGLWISILPDV